MRPLTFASILCGIGLVVFVGTQARRQMDAEPLFQAPEAARPSPSLYRITNRDEPYGDRTSTRFIEVELGESARGKDVHAIFAEIARHSGFDSVNVRGYWGGDNSDLYGYTAGK